jgi:hypothetical protein
MKSRLSKQCKGCGARVPYWRMPQACDSLCARAVRMGRTREEQTLHEMEEAVRRDRQEEREAVSRMADYIANREDVYYNQPYLI